MMKLLLDSVIIIDHLNGITAASEFIANNFKDSAISVITRAEVLTGCDAKNNKLVRFFLDQFQTLTITSNDADLAASIRQKQKLKLPDALQAALAQNHKLTLVTRNTKDFTKRKFSNVLVPYTT